MAQTTMAVSSNDIDMRTDNLYDIIGVASTATQKEIRSAYRRKARQLHPDSSGDPASAGEFRRLVAAFEILSDDAKRGAYESERRQPNARKRAARPRWSKGVPDWSSRARGPEARKTPSGTFEDVWRSSFQDLSTADFKTPYRGGKRTSGGGASSSAGSGSSAWRAPSGYGAETPVPGFEMDYKGETLDSMYYGIPTDDFKRPYGMPADAPVSYGDEAPIPGRERDYVSSEADNVYYRGGVSTDDFKRPVGMAEEWMWQDEEERNDGEHMMSEEWDFEEERVIVTPPPGEEEESHMADGLQEAYEAPAKKAYVSPPIDEERKTQSPGISHNFYDVPAVDFKKPFDVAVERANRVSERASRVSERAKQNAARPQSQQPEAGSSNDESLQARLKRLANLVSGVSERANRVTERADAAFERVDPEAAAAAAAAKQVKKEAEAKAAEEAAAAERAEKEAAMVAAAKAAEEAAAAKRAEEDAASKKKAEEAAVKAEAEAAAAAEAAEEPEAAKAAEEAAEAKRAEEEAKAKAAQIKTAEEAAAAKRANEESAKKAAEAAVEKLEEEEETAKKAAEDAAAKKAEEELRAPIEPAPRPSASTMSAGDGELKVRLSRLEQSYERLGGLFADVRSREKAFRREAAEVKQELAEVIMREEDASKDAAELRAREEISNREVAEMKAQQAVARVEAAKLKERELKLEGREKLQKERELKVEGLEKSKERLAVLFTKARTREKAMRKDASETRAREAGAKKEAAEFKALEEAARKEVAEAKAREASLLERLAMLEARLEANATDTNNADASSSGDKAAAEVIGVAAVSQPATTESESVTGTDAVTRLREWLGLGDAAAESSVATFAESFGTLKCNLGNTTVVDAPVWLVSALEFNSSLAERLIGQQIIYRFDDADGGWKVGTIKTSLTDDTNTVEVEGGDDDGAPPMNFLVEYDEESFEHCLEVSDYAKTAGADEGCWCLLAAIEGKANASWQRVVSQGDEPAAKVKDEGHGAAANGTPQGKGYVANSTGKEPTAKVQVSGFKGIGKEPSANGRIKSKGKSKGMKPKGRGKRPALTL